MMEKGQKHSGREAAGFFLLGLSLLMLGKSVMLCFSNDIWYDELFTVGMIEHSYGELIRFTAADVHPPLYYCIVKLFVELCKLIAPGADIVVLAKLASILPYGVLMLYSVTFIRRRFGMLVAGLFSFCMLAMPQLSAYTVEMRMYGWAMLFVTAAFLHAWEWMVDDGNRKTGGHRQSRACCMHAAALVFYGLAAAYTQYFAGVAVGMVYLWLLIVLILRGRDGMRTWILCAAVSAAGYVPWLAVLAKQLHAVGENYWILPLTWRSLGGCVKFLMKPAFSNGILSTVMAVILACGCGASILYVVVRGLRRCDCGGMTKSNKISHNSRVLDMQAQERERAVFVLGGVGVLAGLIAFGFAASLLFRPVFVYRYMIPAAGCFWLSVAVALNELWKPTVALQEGDALWKRRKATESVTKLCKLNSATGYAACAAFAFILLLVIAGLRDYRAFMGEEEYKAVSMRDTEAAFSLIGERDLVLYNFDQVQAVTGWYLPETVERYLWRAEGEKLIQEITTPCGTATEVSDIREMLEQAQRDGQERTLWFIGSFNSREDVVDEWREAGFEVKELENCLLERYWFKLYKISGFRPY